MQENQDFVERLYRFTKIFYNINEQKGLQHKANFNKLHNYLKHSLFKYFTIELINLTKDSQLSLLQQVFENTSPYLLDSTFINELSFHYYIFSITLEYIKTNISILKNVNFSYIRDLDELVIFSNIFKFYHHKEKFGDIRVIMINDTPPESEQYYELELKTPFDISSELEEINLQGNSTQQDISIAS